MKKYAIALPLLLLLLSCGDSDLQKVAKSMLILSKAIGEVQTDTIAAIDAKLIDADTASQILNVCIKINVAGKQVDALLRSISQLDPASRGNLVNLLTPISQALDPTKLEFIAGIKNLETQQQIQAAFTIMRSAVSTIQLILASGG